MFRIGSFFNIFRPRYIIHSWVQCYWKINLEKTRIWKYFHLVINLFRLFIDSFPILTFLLKPHFSRENGRLTFVRCIFIFFWKLCFCFTFMLFCFIGNGEKSWQIHMNSNSKNIYIPNLCLNFSSIDLKNERPDIARLRCKRKETSDADLWSFGANWSVKTRYGFTERRLRNTKWQSEHKFTSTKKKMTIEDEICNRAIGFYL